MTSADPPDSAPSEPGGFSLRAIGRSALILTGGTAAVQVLAIVRELFLAAQIGVSTELDALLIAVVLPTTLAGIVTSGMVTALVPAYLKVRDTADRPQARRFAGGILLWVALAGLTLTLIIGVFPDIAVAITGPGLGPVARESAIGYLQLLAPVALVAAVSSTLAGVCQAEEQFGAMAAASLAGPAITLATMLVLWDRLELGSVAVGSLLGPIVSGLVLLGATIRASAMPLPTLHLPRGETVAFLRHAAPLTLSSAVLQLNVIVDRAIATLLVPGGISALRYADVLVRAPISAIAPAWGSAIYPALVRAARSDDEGALGNAVERTIGYAIALFVPVAMLAAAVAPVAVRVAYGRGAFGDEDLALTAPLVAAFAPLIVVLMVSPVLVSAHNARRRGTILLIGGTLNAILNLVLDVALGATLGVVGVALSSSITSTVVLVYFAQRLARSEREFHAPSVARKLATASMAAAPPALVIALFAWGNAVPAGLIPGVVALVAFGLAGLAAYGVIATRLGLDEPQTIVRLGRERFARARRTTS